MTVTPVVPGAPSLAPAVPGDGQVRLFWVPPVDDGGASVTDYLINEYQGSGTSGTPSVIDTGSPGTSATISHLTNGQPYTFTVVAVNSAGDGAASDPQPATPATLPGAPSLIATVSGSSLVEVVWDPPAADGGAPVSAYDVFRSTTAGTRGSQIAAVAPGSPPMTYVDPAVTNGVTYYYEVAAVNRAGQGPASTQFFAQPQSFLPPPVLATTIRIRGQQVTFSSPNRCIRAGQVTGRLAVSSPRHRPKLLIASAVFRVGNLAKKTLTRRQPSSAAMPVRLHAKRMAATRRYEFVAQPSIVPGQGRAYRHTLRLTISAC